MNPLARILASSARRCLEVSFAGLSFFAMVVSEKTPTTCSAVRSQRCLAVKKVLPTLYRTTRLDGRVAATFYAAEPRLSRMSPNLVQKPSNLDMVYVVELQKKFCDSTDVSQRRDSSIIFNLKMFTPIVLSRIKESDKPIGFNINGRQVATFAAIAGKAGPRQISDRRFATMFRRDDMVGFVGK
jgi:hypothetical protein